MQSKTILVVHGGRSPEHAVSCRSVAGVIEALSEKGHEVVSVRIDHDGQWSQVRADGVSDVFLSPTPPAVLRRVIDGKALSRPDVAFPVLHGSNGEDGAIHGLFQLCGLPTVGCDLASSAAAMHKGMMRKIFSSKNIPQVDYVELDYREFASVTQLVDAITEANLGPMLFVKPARSGSSIGVSLVSDDQQLLAAVDTALAYDSTILVEKAVSGPRELEVAVMRRGCEVITSVVGEVLYATPYLSYEGKYSDPRTVTDVPANIGASLCNAVRGMAVDCYRALGCDGLVRVDFLVDGEESVYALEMNTIPGLGRHGMSAQLWAAAGVPYGDLLEALVSSARVPKHAGGLP